MSVSKGISTQGLRPIQRSFSQIIQRPGWINTIRRQLWWNNFGGRLFCVVMLGTLTGMGGMTFLFSEMLKRQAEDQVRNSVDSKVNAIASITESAETLAYGLGISAVTLNERKAQDADTYRGLVQQLFEQRPEFVAGLGLGQAENGIVQDQSWLFPHYTVVNSEKSTISTTETVRYEDLADDIGEFYPKSERYKTYFLPKEKLWSKPYIKDGSRRITFYYPLFNRDGLWLGTSLVDIDTANLNNVLDGQVFQQSGRFLLLTRSGLLIADPSNPFTKVESYKDVANVKPIWDHLNKDVSGFIHGETGYWAYSQIPGKDWLLLGFVPYEAVFGRIIKLTILITGLVGLIIATIIYCGIQTLSQRIKPILLQANQFAHNDPQFTASSTHHDELDQLSLSFFNILNQLNLFQTEIHHHEETIVQNDLQFARTVEGFLSFTTKIDTDVSGQQRLLHQTKQQLAEQVNVHQSVDGQLDVLYTLTHTLEGVLGSMSPEGQDAQQLFEALDQHISTLTNTLEHSSSMDKVQVQAVIMQLITDVATLKNHHRQFHVFRKLQYLKKGTTLKQPAITVEAQIAIAITQDLYQTLSEIEAINGGLGQCADQLSETL